MQARTLSCFVDADQLDEVLSEIDTVIVPTFARYEGFRGLLCLTDDSWSRPQILAISLWNGKGIDDTEAQVEDIRQAIAAATNLGVATSRLTVLRDYRLPDDTEDDDRDVHSSPLATVIPIEAHLGR